MRSPAFLLRAGLLGRWHDRSSAWSPERLQHRRATGLAALRAYASRHSPFYASFHRGLDGAPLQALPILTKATLMAEFDRIVTPPGLHRAELEAHLAGADAALPFRGRYTVLSTSGSTGLRGLFVFDRREWLHACAAITRPLLWAGAPAPWTRPRAALIASAAPWHYSAGVGRSLASRWLPSLRLDAATPLPELVRQLQAWQPQALAAYPSVLAQLADEQLAGRLDIRPLHVGCSAERLTPAVRARVRQAWQVPVFDTYGATEYAPIASECRHGSLHLLEDRAVIEVVDDAGRAVRDGEAGARLLLTVLDRRTQPLIRYELSDGVRLLPGACACGRPFRRIAAIEGRVEDTLLLPAARHGSAPVALHPNVFHDLLEGVPASGWQVRQRADGTLAVLLTGAPDAPALAALEGRIHAALADRGAARPVLQVRRVAALPRGATGKAPLVVREPAAALHPALAG